MKTRNKLFIILLLLIVLLSFSLISCGKQVSSTTTTKIAGPTTAITQATTTTQETTTTQAPATTTTTVVATTTMATEKDIAEQRMVNLSIFNGNGIDNSAYKISKILEVKYNILEIGDAVYSNYPITEIRVYSDAPYITEAVYDIKAILKAKTTISEPVTIKYLTMNELIDSDIIIVLGVDYK